MALLKIQNHEEKCQIKFQNKRKKYFFLKNGSQKWQNIVWKENVLGVILKTCKKINL
jgi:hypothetical protein